MAVTAAQQQALILLEIKESASGPVGSSVATVWAMFEEQRVVAPKMQYYCVLRKMAELKLGWLTDAIDTKDIGLDHHFSQLVTNMQQVIANANREIHLLTDEASANRGGVAGQITATEPISVATPPGTGPNSRVYRGDPWYRR